MIIIIMTKTTSTQQILLTIHIFINAAWYERINKSMLCGCRFTILHLATVFQNMEPDEQNFFTKQEFQLKPTYKKKGKSCDNFEKIARKKIDI